MWRETREWRRGKACVILVFCVNGKRAAAKESPKSPTTVTVYGFRESETLHT